MMGNTFLPIPVDVFPPLYLPAYLPAWLSADLDMMALNMLLYCRARQTKHENGRFPLKYLSCLIKLNVIALNLCTGGVRVRFRGIYSSDPDTQQSASAGAPSASVQRLSHVLHLVRWWPRWQRRGSGAMASRAMGSRLQSTVSTQQHPCPA